MTTKYYRSPVTEFQTCVEILFRDAKFTRYPNRKNPPVKRDHGPPAQGAANFHTTHWTVVLSAAQSQESGATSALGELFRLYWYPLYIFARCRGHSPHDAQDLTQGFFLRLIERKALIRANPLKGKFRSFLLTSFKNYLCTEAERTHCYKRGGHYKFVSLDLENAENRYLLEPVAALTPEKIFDARWALTLLDRTMTRLAEEYAIQGRASVFETLKVFLKASGVCSPSYEGAAKALGVSLGAAKSLIHRLRKRCASILREEVARTVSDPGEIDAEIHALCTALIASGGSLDP
jgi:RNA polymerase sigma factor (sigma-70 family)